MRRWVAREGIQRHGPVDARRLLSLFDVRYVPFSPATLGCAVFGVRWRRDHRILVNASLNEYERRAVVGHELGHRLLKHTGSFHLCSLGEWWYAKSEREAEIASAIIWIRRPLLEQLIARGLDVSELEESFGVPERLLRLRLEVP